MHVDIIDDLAVLARLKDNWERVYAADPEAQYFLSFTWIYNWFSRVRIRWLIAAAKPSPQSSDYVAFFPLQIATDAREDGTLYNVTRMGGSPFAVYTGFIIDPAHESEAVIALADAVVGLEWSAVQLDDVYASDRRYGAFLGRLNEKKIETWKKPRVPHVARNGENIDYDTFVYVNLPADWETFLSENLGTNTRRDARAFLRKVDVGGEYRITHADASTIERDLETFYRFWGAQWQNRNPRYAEFLLKSCRRMLMPVFEAGALFVPVVLWQGDTPIGVHIAFIDPVHKTLLCFLVSRDLSVKKPPPGFVLHCHSMRWAIEQGFSIYDLGTGDFSYKYSFKPIEHKIEHRRAGSKALQNLRGRLEPRSLKDAIARSKALLRSGAIAKARLSCGQILEADPGLKVAQDLMKEINGAHAKPVSLDFSRATELQKKGKKSEAEEIYRAILAQDPNRFDARNALGFVLLDQRKYEAAAENLALAITLDPKVAATHNNRGVALKALKRREEALACFEKAVELKADYIFALHNRGDVLRELSRFEDAIASYDLAIANSSRSSETHNHRGIALKALGRLDEALASFDRAIELNPRNASAHFNRGNVLSLLDSHDEAIESFDKALEIRPDFAEAHEKREAALKAQRRAG